MASPTRSLKKYLRVELDRRLVGHRSAAASLERSLGVLGKTNLRKANYTIQLDSLWADTGEKSVTVSYTGSLEDAIREAEAKFRRKNSRSDVPAEYSVRVNIGEDSCIVPEEYWKDFKSRT